MTESNDNRQEPVTHRNLLSLNTFFYRRGGSEAVFFDHDELFRGIGWDTAMFAMHHPQNFDTPWSEYFVDELEFGHAYGALQKLKMAGKVIYSFEAKDKLSRLLEKFQPDIAHGHLLYHHLSPSVMALLHERGVPTVMTAHDLKIACPAYTMYNATGVCERCIDGNLLNLIRHKCVRGSLSASVLVAVESSIHKSLRLWRRNLDRVVTPSRFYKDKFIEWGWPEDKLVYIPNYIDSSAYHPDFEPGDYFFYFGRLTKQKGVDTLIEAAKAQRCRLLIAGTGPEEDELKRQAAGADNIEFLGYCTGEHLHTLIREARAIILPSVGYENAPISVLEAYASGKPVIGARIGGIPELIEEGVTGMTFESTDGANLGQCLSAFADMPLQEIRGMGENGRELVETTFTQKNYLERTLALYETLLGRS